MPQLCILIRASAQKVGFPPVAERPPKSLQTVLFALLLCKKCGFAHFLALFLQLAETPLLRTSMCSLFGLELKHTIPGRFFSFRLLLPDSLCSNVRPQVLGVPRSGHAYLNSVQQMVSGELAGEGLQTGFSRHGLPPQRAPLDTVYPLREHLNSVQRMVSGRCCEGLFPDTVCWTRLRNTWSGCFKTGCLQYSRSFALFCSLLRSFALFCAHLRSFALIACFCIQPRLERPHLETPEGRRFHRKGPLFHGNRGLGPPPQG